MWRCARFLVWTLAAVLTAGDVGPRLAFPPPAPLTQRAAAHKSSDELQWVAPTGELALVFSRAEANGMRPARLPACVCFTAAELHGHRPGGVWLVHPVAFSASFLACPTRHEPLLI